MANERVEINDEILEGVSGGSILLKDNKDGTFTITGDFTGDTLTLPVSSYFNFINIAGKYPNTEEGEISIFKELRG